MNKGEKVLRDLIRSVEAELDFVREKYGIKGDDFSCPYFIDMAEKVKAAKMFLCIPDGG